MNKWLILGILLGLCYFVYGCGSSDKKTYIVAGQSNAVRCDWSYYEKKTGNRIINIARGAHTIDDLIAVYEPVSGHGVFFIHGESDSKLGTDPNYYIERVKEYQVMIGVPMYISTVGYNRNYPPDHFDMIRKAQKKNFTVLFDEAKNFIEWGMLIDQVHFSEEGCKRMMKGFAAL